MPTFWRLTQVRRTKFGMSVSYKKLRNFAKCQLYCFYHFWVIMGRPIGVNLFLPTMIRFNALSAQIWLRLLYIIFRIIIGWEGLFSKPAKYRISNVRDNKYGAFLPIFKSQSKFLKLIRSHLKIITIHCIQNISY